MHDLVIRNGTVVDGTGRPRFAGDAAVDQGVISALGATSR
jgi:N-acyl-D-amino-acid deacylase